MGWSIGYDEKWKRDIGYGVPAVCDYPDCHEEIDRGLSHVCGSHPHGGAGGCGLFFCDQHLLISHDEVDEEDVQMCVRCATGEDAFSPKPDVQEWVDWKLTDASWKRWRDENPVEVEKLRATR